MTDPIRCHESNAELAIGYGIQRSPTEQHGEAGTALLLARKD